MEVEASTMGELFMLKNFSEIEEGGKYEIQQNHESYNGQICLLTLLCWLECFCTKTNPSPPTVSLRNNPVVKLRNNQAVRGQSGWVLQAVISRASFRRIPRSGKSFFTVVSLHINNTYDKKR